MPFPIELSGETAAGLLQGLGFEMQNLRGEAAGGPSVLSVKIADSVSVVSLLERQSNGI